jgi:hypothetical protein
VEFEFDRAILTLAGRPGDRYARLRNLASARVWSGMPDARVRYQQLVATSGLDDRQRANLIEEFQQRHPASK